MSAERDPEAVATATTALDRVDRLVDERGVDLDGATLERLRTSLPTDPEVAPLVAAGLPPALRATLEYVSPSTRQAGYWRTRRARRDPDALSTPELRQRRAFIAAARANRGRVGITTHPADRGENADRVISAGAARLGATLSGRRFRTRDDDPTERERRRRDRLVERFQSVLAALSGRN